MRKSLVCLFSAFSFLLLLAGCHKESVPSAQPASFLSVAKEYFVSTYSSEVMAADSFANQYDFHQTSRIVNWDKAIVETIQVGQAVVVPVQYKNPFVVQTSFGAGRLFNINELQYLFLYKDKEAAWHAELCTQFPDSNAFVGSNVFTGIVRVDNWQGDFIKEYKYGPYADIKKLIKQPEKKSLQNQGAENSGIYEICYYSTGYNYMARTDEGAYWTVDLGCEYQFEDGGGDDVGGPGGYNYIPPTAGTGGGYAAPVTILAGKNIIANIKDYNKCFDNIAGSSKTYTVSVCVDQPVEGSRQAWGFFGSSSSGGNSPFAVGHAFLILSESGYDGTITRNVGFYPKGSVNPASPESGGQLNNDANHDYDISLTITMDNSQFFTLLDFVNNGNNSGNNYNLNSNNCTNFVVNALASTGIHVANTRGSWLGGAGANPGDLGEDIRHMTLQSNMTRQTDADDHPNIGICY